jgi:predicted nucleic acid-binding protein
MTAPIVAQRTGAIQSPRRFLAPYRLLPVDEPVMLRFAELPSALRRDELIPDLDLLIAATALRHDLTLLTFNVRHVQRVSVPRLCAPAG